MLFYLIGIKGSGMSALALYLKDSGHKVVGSDVSNFIYTETNLISNNIKIYELTNKDYQGADTVIIGHNFYTDELVSELKNLNIPFYQYNEFLSLLEKDKLVTISGSHGKTTLTKMLSEAYKSSYICGDGTGHKAQDAKYFFMEACEYKNHFFKYEPRFEFVTNIDYDHVDFFKTVSKYNNSFKEFAKKVNIGLVYFKDSHKIDNPFFYTFGLDDYADFYLKNYIYNEEGISGDFYFKDQYITSFSFTKMFGKTMLLNILQVLAFGYLHGENLLEVKAKLTNFNLPNKRFNIYKIKNSIIIDDYGHHPTQISENYDTIKNTYKDYNYVLIYKPDRISRVKYFKEEFKNAFNLFDKTLIIDFNDKENCSYLDSFENEKISHINNNNDIKENIDFTKPTVFLMSSSKNLNEIKLILYNNLNEI